MSQFPIRRAVAAVLAEVEAVAGPITDLSGYKWFDWRWATIGGEIVFAGIVLWIIVDLFKRIDELAASVPKLHIALLPVRYGNIAVQVTNSGGTGSVSAQVELVNEVNESFQNFPYRGQWAGEAEAAVVLMQGHSARLLLGRASFPQPSNPDETVDLYFLELWVGPGSQNPRHLINWKPSQRSEPPEAILRVVFSTSPALSSGPVVRVYRFNAKGDFEDITECGGRIGQERLSRMSSA